jgi:HD superfamily phosphohydrolase
MKSLTTKDINAFKFLLKLKGNIAKEKTQPVETEFGTFYYSGLGTWFIDFSSKRQAKQLAGKLQSLSIETTIFEYDRLVEKSDVSPFSGEVKTKKIKMYRVKVSSPRNRYRDHVRKVLKREGALD